ncbi:hypothetical protein ACS0TY_003571 [Phlomoides rotata]
MISPEKEDKSQIILKYPLSYALIPPHHRPLFVTLYNKVTTHMSIYFTSTNTHEMGSMASSGHLYRHKSYKRNHIACLTPPFNLTLVSHHKLKRQQQEEETPHQTSSRRNYNPDEGGGRKKAVSKEEAMQELLEVIKSTKPDNFTPKITEKRDDYVRVEYESPILGFVDDVEFWFPPGKKWIVQYRSASRLGNFDFDVNRKRIKENLGYQETANMDLISPEVHGAYH